MEDRTLCDVNCIWCLEEVVQSCWREFLFPVETYEDSKELYDFVAGSALLAIRKEMCKISVLIFFYGRPLIKIRSGIGKSLELLDGSRPFF